MELSGLTFPNHYMSVKLKTLDELMGTNGLHALLNSAGLKDWIATPPPQDPEREIDYAHIAAIMGALRDLYGEKGSQSLLRPASKTVFLEVWSKDEAFSFITDQAFTALDPSEKLFKGIQTFSEILSRDTDLQCSAERKDAGVLFSVGQCPFCWGETDKNASCHTFIGMLEQVALLVMDEAIDVREISCASSGDPSCIFEITLPS